MRARDCTLCNGSSHHSLDRCMSFRLKHGPMPALRKSQDTLARKRITLTRRRSLWHEVLFDPGQYYSWIERNVLHTEDKVCRAPETHGLRIRLLGGNEAWVLRGPGTKGETFAVDAYALIPVASKSGDSSRLHGWTIRRSIQASGYGLCLTRAAGRCHAFGNISGAHTRISRSESAPCTSAPVMASYGNIPFVYYPMAQPDKRR